jgi:hypothetical protein
MTRTPQMTREEWRSCKDARHLMSVVAEAHRRGQITRQKLVHIALKCVQKVVDFLPSGVRSDTADVNPEEMRKLLSGLYVNGGPAASAAYVAYATYVINATDNIDIAVGYAANVASLVSELVDRETVLSIIRSEVAFEDVTTAFQRLLLLYSDLRANHDR